MIRQVAKRLVLAVAGVTLATVAQAEEITVFAAGAVKHAMTAAQEPFERATGHRLVFTFDTVGALRDRVLAGERPHLIVVSAAAIDALVSAGHIARAEARDLGAIGVALAVRRGAPVPDVSTAERLTSVLRAAPSIAYGSPARGATAGTHFERILDRLGLLAEIRGKARVVDFGVQAIDAVAEGSVALGVSQASEIAPVTGVSLVAPLPPEFRLETRYAVAPVTNSAGGSAFRAFLQGSEGRSLLRAVGFSD